MLVKNPGFTAISVLTLALGIGANTAMFSVVHALLLKAMPFHEPDRIITVWQSHLPSGYDRNTVSPANFLDWREQNTVFSRMALWEGARRNLTGEGDPQRLVGARVSSGYFEIFGAIPLMGRVFSEAEDFEGPEKAIILSRQFWNDRFNSDESIIGTAITIDSEPHIVVGVMPETFDFPANRDIWVPLAFSADEVARRDMVYLQALGRLKPGLTLTQAQSEMDVLAARLRKAYPEENVDVGIFLVPLHDHLVRNVRPAMLLLLGAVGMVLLITCANVANLLLVKGASRRQELGIRSALGAGRWRIVRQLLTESLVLSTIGGGLGILIAYWSIDLLAIVVSDRMPAFFQESIGLNGTVLMFALGLSLLTGVLFGIVTSLTAAKHDIATVMKDRDQTQSLVVESGP